MNAPDASPGSGRSTLLVAAGYAAAAAAAIYGWLDRTEGTGDWVAVVVGLAHLVLGFALARWWAVLLPLLLPVIALPAGAPASGDDVLVSVVLLILLPVFAALVAAGVAARKLTRRAELRR